MLNSSLTIIEYKGGIYVTNDDSKEKNVVGVLWANNGGDNALFLMSVDKREQRHTSLLITLDGFII